jgi:hypothetical protein
MNPTKTTYPERYHGFGVVLAAFVLTTATAGMDAAQAADNHARWSGKLIVTNVTAACADVYGTDPLAFHSSVYRPKLSPDDGPTYLSILGSEAARTLENTSESSAHQMQGSGNYHASAIDSAALPFTFNGTYSFTITPSVVTAATPTVTIVGTIHDFVAAGCTIAFRAAYISP